MKNNCYIVLAALLATLTGGSAEAKIPTLQPNTVRVIDFESDAILHEALAYEFIQATQPPMENTGDYEFADIEFTSESKKIAQECVWWAVGPGCSWYCGGGPDTITCSSQLPPKGGDNYACKHVHDLRFDSAWVEGAKGYGIGEWVQYHFTPSSPRITTIMVANGYSKSKRHGRRTRA